METTIEQQVAMDEALVPSAQRCPFYKAFLVTADVPEIYMQEFWATANVHQHSIRFKMDNKKHILDLESFRNILHICPRVQGQSFAKLPFEEEILDFIQFLGHSATIRTLTDVNINKLYQLWRSFAAIINKCLTGKTYGYDSLRLSQAQILHQNTQQFGALLPIELTNEEIRNSKTYKEYHAIATGKAAPKPKASARRTRSGSDTSITPPTSDATTRPTAAATPRLTAAAKDYNQEKQTADAYFSAWWFWYKEGTGFKPGVPEVPTDESEEELLWNSSDDEGADEKGKDGNGDEDDERDDGEEGEEDDDDEEQEVAKNDDKDDTEESGDDDEEGSSDEEDDNEETRDEERFDPIPQIPKSKADELYRDVDINQGRGLQVNQEVEDFHVILTPVHPDGQQESSSVSSQFVTNILNQTSDAVSAIPEIVQHFMDQQMNEAVQVVVQLQSDRLSEEAQKENDEFLRTVDENIKKIIKEQVKEQVKAQVSKILPRIEQAVNEQLKAKVLTRSSHSSRTSYTVAADLSEMELKKILIEKMEGNKSIQCSDAQRNLYKAIVDAYESNKIILNTYGKTVTLKRRRDDDEDKDEKPSAGPDRGSKRRREDKEPESASTPSETATKSIGRSTTGSRSRQASTSESAFAEEPIQTTSQMEEPSHPEFEIGADDQPIKQSSQHPEWFSQPKKPPSPDHDWNKTLPAVHESIQPWISKLAKQADTRSSFNELMDTPLDFSNFIMNRLRVDTLTPKLLVRPTYDLVNPEGQQYPHNLLQPLSLIPDNRGRRVIPFAHFINNDLAYLRGGASSCKYTTSVTKTKAGDYGHIKWIEDLVPRTITVSLLTENLLAKYSKRRIIAVTKLKIMEWHSYKYLDWITVRRNDDKLYKFKEGDLKRLRIQDIKDMLLLLVQGKLTNLMVEERFAFNVSLRMFTRSIVIQRCVEDLQVGFKSYQKKLNLTKPDMYRSDLKRKEAYTAYSNPCGFIYQNKDKQNRGFRCSICHKQSGDEVIKTEQQP
nr:hypothetical protein [Tanacetum cinerariifolium]